MGFAAQGQAVGLGGGLAGVGEGERIFSIIILFVLI
jgi:hypothetical protein